MATKIKTVEDIYKDDVKSLIKNLNQKLKLLGSMAYISHKGEIFIKNNDRQLERYCKIYDNDKMPRSIAGTIFDTLEVYDFYKIFKTSKMKLLLLDSAIVVSQEDCKDELRLNQLLSKKADDIEKSIINDTIFPEFYKRLPQLINPFEENYEWKYVSEEQIQAMEDGEMIKIDYEMEDKNIHAYITKQIFPLIKKCDEIAYTVLDIVNPLDNKYFYILYRERYASDGLFVYTLTATYQSI